MKIYIVPMSITGFDRQNIIIRQRKGERPVLFMQDVIVNLNGYQNAGRNNRQNANLNVVGRMGPDVRLQDGDVLLVQAKDCPLDSSVELELEEHEGAYLTPGTLPISTSIAAFMEERLCV